MHKILLASSLVSLAPLAMAADTLSLRVAIERALAQNQSVRISDYSRDIASGNLTAARGFFDPVLGFERTQASDRTPVLPGAGGAASWQDNHVLTLGGNTPWGATYALSAKAATFRGAAYQDSEYTAANAALSLRQPLMRGFGFSNGLEQLRVARADKKIAEWQFEVTLADTVTAVVSAYVEVLQARDQLRITEGYRDAVRQLGIDHERRLAIGALADADVANAQSRAAQIEESVHFAWQNARDAEQRLLRLLGEPIEGADGLELEAVPIPDPLTPDRKADVARALAHRPEVLAARQGLVRAETIRAARSLDLLPRVDLVASVGYGDLDVNYARARDSVLDREHRLYSAGLVVSVPLTSAEARGRLRAARASVRQREEEISSLEADVAVDIHRIARFLAIARARVETLERAQVLARRSLDAEEKRFRAGTGNTFFVLQQQGELASVEGNLVRARADLVRAAALYDRATARTLERFGITIAP